MTEVEKTRIAMLEGCIDRDTSFDDACRMVKMVDDTLEMAKAQLRDAVIELSRASGIVRLIRKALRAIEAVMPA